MTGSQSLLRSGRRLKETSTCSLMRRSQNTLTAKATAVLLHLLQPRHHFQFIYIQALILGTSLDPGTGKNPWDAEGTSDEALKFSRDEESGLVIRQHCWMRHLYEFMAAMMNQPQLRGLKQGVSSLPVLEVKILKPRCRQGWFLWRGSLRESSPASSAASNSGPSVCRHTASSTHASTFTRPLLCPVPHLSSYIQFRTP